MYDKCYPRSSEGAETRYILWEGTFVLQVRRIGFIFGIRLCFSGLLCTPGERPLGAMVQLKLSGVVTCMRWREGLIAWMHDLWGAGAVSEQAMVC